MSAKGAYLREIILDYLCGSIVSPSGPTYRTYPSHSSLWLGWLSDFRGPTDIDEIPLARTEISNVAASWTTPHTGARALALPLTIALSGATSDAIGFALYASATSSDVLYAGLLGRRVACGRDERLAPGALVVCEYKHGSTLNERILDYVCGNTALSSNNIPAWWVGLSSATIDTGVWSGDTYPGLARASFDNYEWNWTENTDGTRTLSLDVFWPQASTALGPLLSWGLFDSASASEPLLRGNLDTALSCVIGDVFSTEGRLTVDEV